MPPRSKSTGPPKMPPATANRKRKTSSSTSEPSSVAEPEPEAPPVPVDIPPTNATAPPAQTTTKPKAAKRAKKNAPENSDDTESMVGTVISEATTVDTTTTVTSKASKTRKKPRKQSNRTPSSYVLFSMNHRKTIVESNPDLSLGEVSKQCGTAWKSMSEDDKKPWIDMATERRKQRALEIEEITKNDPPKKKRTPSSYLLFAMQHRKVVLQEKPTLTIGEVSKICGSTWKGMADNLKQEWKDKADALKV